MDLIEFSLEKPYTSAYYYTNKGYLKFDLHTQSFYDENNFSIKVEEWFKASELPNYTDKANAFMKHKKWNKGERGMFDYNGLVSFFNEFEVFKTKPEIITYETVVDPVVKWLNENQHPHTTIIITHTCAELFEGLKSHVTEKYLKG